MTDYRALCVELLDALENAIRVIYHEDGTKHISTADTVIAKADDALAQPEPEGPSVEELAQLIYERAMVPAAVHCKVVTQPWVSRGNSIAQDDARDCARAVLARWGRPAITPVPVSERFEFSVAQAVMEAYWDTPNEPITTQIHQAAVAAAIRAAADQLFPEPDDWVKDNWSEQWLWLISLKRDQLLAIADELEGGAA